MIFLKNKLTRVTQKSTIYDPELVEKRVDIKSISKRPSHLKEFSEYDFVVGLFKNKNFENTQHTSILKHFPLYQKQQFNLRQLYETQQYFATKFYKQITDKFNYNEMLLGK